MARFDKRLQLNCEGTASGKSNSKQINKQFIKKCQAVKKFANKRIQDVSNVAVGVDTLQLQKWIQLLHS